MFTAGQFVLFDVPLLEHPGDIQPRAYSIASAPSEEALLFVIKLVPNGRASGWIEKSVDIGTLVTMKGPFGRFTLDETTTKPYLFVGTGTGVAPLRSQILWALDQRVDTRPMHLLFGVVHLQDMFWEQTWKDVEERHANFRAHVSFLSGEEDWHGEHGSVQERIPQIIGDFSNVSVYLCGAPAIVTELKQFCLQRGVPKEDIHAEKFV